MLTHGKIWTAIDALARRYGLSPSGLAKRAGLDATAFNPSKRVTTEGRPRWLTTESLAKVLSATGATLDEFVDLLEAEAAGLRKAPQPIPHRFHPGRRRRLRRRWRLSRWRRLGSNPLPLR